MRRLRFGWAMLIAAAFFGTSAPVRAQSPPAPPADNALLSTGRVPDVQVVVGPGKDGWQVAVVYPNEVGKERVKADVASVAQALAAPATGLKIENRRLDREDTSQVGPAPSMTSATFETVAELVDYGAGRLSPEPFLVGLQAYDRVNVTFLVPGKFSYRAARRVTDNRLTLELAGGEGAFTFVANIRSRPVDGFVVPAQDTPVPAAAPPTARRPFGARALVWVVGFAAVAGCAAYFAMRRFVRT